MHNVLLEYSGIFSFSFRFTAASALSFISEQYLIVWVCVRVSGSGDIYFQNGAISVV